MTSKRIELEKQKLIQEKCQQILTQLLRDEDNKYCVDCDAKGPRWVSWNLGIFLCIRCAGIHRNLGVHISKVKSVNLDSWTPEQIAHLQQMGNSKARAVYEANLPDNFRRPQTDSSLEAFIRAKYEQKKYIAKEWVPPPTPLPAFDIEEERRKDKEKKKLKLIKIPNNSQIVEVQMNPVPRPHSTSAGVTINPDKVPIDGCKKTSIDLLGLNTNNIKEKKEADANEDDPFDAFVSAPLSSTSSSSASTAVNTSNTSIKEESRKESKSAEEEDFFNQKVPVDKKLDKESILKLYESTNHSNINPLQNTLNPYSCQGFAANSSITNLAPPPSNPLFANQNGLNIDLSGNIAQPTLQNSYFPSTTNPFLSTHPNNASFTQIQHQMTSLQIGTGNEQKWISEQSFNQVNNVPLNTSGMINPFISNLTSSNASNSNLFPNSLCPQSQDDNSRWINGLSNSTPIAAANSVDSMWQ